MKSDKKEQIEKIYATLCEKMDARDRFFILLQRMFDKDGKIPSIYVSQWNTYQKDKRLWREIPGVKRRLYKTACRLYRNTFKSQNYKKIKTEKYLKKQLHKLGRESK